MTSRAAQPRQPTAVRRRRLTALRVLATLVAAGAALIVPSAAQAAVPAASALVCSGTQTLNYSPGVTLTPRLLTVSGGASLNCTSPNDPSLTAGSLSVSPVQASLACGVTQYGTYFTYQWNNGQSSTVFGNSVSTLVAGGVNVTSTGTVVAGEFTGDSAVISWIGVSRNVLGCLARGGATQLSGPLTVNFATA